MSAADAASPDNIDIRTLGRGLRKSLRTILLASALAAGAAYLVSSSIAPRYVSEAQLTLAARAPSNPFTDPKSEGAVPDAVTVRMDKEALNTHVSALKSPDLAARIAAELKLEEKVEFNSALGNPDPLSTAMRLVGLYGPRPGESVKDRALGVFFRQLEVFAVKESRVIHVRFTSQDAALAATVANTIAETYRKMVGAERGAGDTTDMIAQLAPKLEQMTRDVAEVEAEVERFRGQANIFTGAQKTTLNEQQLGELTAELSRLKAQRSEMEAKARSARELAQTGSADALPDVQRSPVMQTILQQRVRLERQISELSATLLPEHPRMRQLNADLANLKSQIKSEVTKIVDGFEKEAKLAAARETSIQKSIDEVKTRVVSGGADEVKLRQLEATAKSKRVELERLQAQYEAGRARTASASAPVEVQILSAAHEASLPNFPKKGSYAGLAFVAMLLFSTALATIKAAFAAARAAAGPNPKRRKTDTRDDEAVAARGKPAQAPAAAPRGPLAPQSEIIVPAAVPAPAPAPAPAAPAAARAPAQAARPAQPEPVLPAVPPALTSIAGRIVERSPQQGGMRTLVVGDHELIDPTAEGIAIARSLCESGAATLVIDWSPMGDGIAEGLGLATVPGMNELMLGTASFEDVVQRVPGSEVHLIACGTALPLDEAEPEADLLNLLLDALDEAYDHIVVVGRHEAARVLFETILGRFDAGILICEGKARANEPADTFLGFEVADIVIMRHDRPMDPAAMAVQRALRATRGVPPGVERIRA